MTTGEKIAALRKEQGMSQEALGEKLAEAFPDAELTVVNGGQPVYYYLISIE